MLFHSTLQQHDSDLAWHDLPLHDIFLDDLSELRTGLLPLGTQQVACRKVHELEVVLDTLALRTLAGAWPAQDEDNCCVLAHQHNKIRCNNRSRKCK